MQRIIYRGAAYRKVTASEIRIAQDAAARDKVLDVVKGLGEKLNLAAKAVGNAFISIKNDLAKLGNSVAKHESLEQVWGTLSASINALAPLKGNAAVKELIDQATSLANSEEFKAITKGGEPAQPAAQESPFAGLGKQMDEAAQQPAQPAQQKA